MTGSAETRPNIGERISVSHIYRDLLLTATFRDTNRAIGSNVTAIDFAGVFAETADELNQLTQADPDRREHATVAYVTPDQKVLIRREITQAGHIGGKLGINMLISEDPSVPKIHRQNRFLGSVIHSHPVDSPPSPVDIARLLLSDNATEAETAAFVVTPARKIIVFRGPNTPQLSKAELETQLELWKKQITDQMGQCVSPNQNFVETFILNLEIQHALTRDIIKNYGLKYFNCPNGQTVARLNPPGQL